MAHETPALHNQFPWLRLAHLERETAREIPHVFHRAHESRNGPARSPLFHFDVHDDVRVGAYDHRVEKDESHPGKVVERSWYEKNKHIFPASRWEVYDPSKNYGGYTIAGKIVTTKDNKHNIFAK